MTSGKPIDGLGVIDDDAVVSGERDLQAAAQRGAVDRGHDRDAERLDRAQLALGLAQEPAELLGVLLVDEPQRVEVAAGEEGLLARR